MSATAPGPLVADRRAVVTGGARGIGGATVALLARHGATVLAVDRDDAALAALRQRCPGVETTVADLTDPTTAGVVAAFEPDVLVNNVGDFVRPPTSFVDASPEEWDVLGEINLGHVLRCTHATLPGMIERGRGGSIVALTTVEAHRGIPGHVVYGTYKAAVRHFTTSLALEVGRHGIRVNAVAPDLIETPQVPYDRLVPQDRRDAWPRWAPLGGPGRPEDVAGAVLFLASDLGRYVTGSTIHVDGGSRAAGGWFAREDGSWTNRPRDA